MGHLTENRTGPPREYIPPCKNVVEFIDLSLQPRLTRLQESLNVFHGNEIDSGLWGQ